jgi:NAD(P)-dependent dehydrogenase (short-subunit alcohol dehydrogenase family)
MAPAELSGQVAIVTGASSGNGRAIALCLASEGAAVLCTDLSPEPRSGGYEGSDSLPTHKLIIKEGGRADFVAADVGHYGQVKRMVEMTMEM